MRVGRRIRLALKWLQACTSIAAICGLQLMAVPLIACMQADDDEMNCPAHAQMHASHSGHGGTKRSGARIQCTGPCHSADSLIVLNPAPVPERVSNVLSLGDPILAQVHGNFDPSGVDDPPGVPPPRI